MITKTHIFAKLIIPTAFVVFINCATVNSFYVNGKLLPCKIYSKCASYKSSTTNSSIIDGHYIYIRPIYNFDISFNPDSFAFIIIDSLNICKYKNGESIRLNPDKFPVTESTYVWLKSNCGGSLQVYRADSFLVSFCLRSNNLNCQEMQYLKLKPTRIPLVKFNGTADNQCFTVW